MKKQITSVNKRKWIVGGVLFFGGLSLLTTGFATWIIGTQIMNARDGLSVVVDTAMNQSVSIAMELSDSSLYLREKVTKNEADADQILSTDNDEEADLTIKFSKITIECGVDYFQDYYCTYDSATGTYTPKAFDLTVGFDLLGNYMSGLSAEQKADKQDLTPNILVSQSNNKFVTERITDDEGNYLSKYTYLDVVTDKISISQAEAETSWKDDAGGFKKLVITEKAFHFKWGTYFSYKNNAGDIVNDGPCAFYNHLSKKNGSAWRTLSNLQKIEEEINAMNEAFKPSGTKKGILALEVSLPDTND